MAMTTARNKQEVDDMTKADRLYDSLKYTYGKKGEMIGQQYDKAFSQADRQALSRGMQRSSYNNQVLANLNKQRIDALNDNESAMIADYENRLADIENQEWQQDMQERQFAETQRQYDTGLAWQKEQAATANSQWEREFGLKQTDAEQSLAWNYVQAALANGKVPSDELLAKAGLTRADAELMAKQASGGGGGGTGGNNKSGSTNFNIGTEDNYNKNKPLTDASLYASLGGDTKSPYEATYAYNKDYQTKSNTDLKKGTKKGGG